MKSLFLVFGVIFSVAFPLMSQEFRAFTDAKGRKIEAAVESVNGDHVKLTKRDKSSFVVRISFLSSRDQMFIKKWVNGSTAPVSSAEGIANVINEAVGVPLFGDSSLWTSSPEEVARRVGWPRESKTVFSESYRKYPGKDEILFGARPYSVALYGEGGRVTGISVVFANKGDSYEASGAGGMQRVRSLMASDYKAIGTTLSKILGRAESQRFGDGESRMPVLRWDWRGHSILLFNAEGEYVSVAIQPTEVVNNGGKTSRIPDSVIRNRIRGSVERRQNGDVVISNIPMVNQGPKGYCVPATVERCMRFFGIPADMYLLAMIGETTPGGGTRPDMLLMNIGRDIKRKGRSFDIENGELKLSDIRRRVDVGIPTIWGMYSTTEFNQIADARTKRRREAWSSHAARVRKEAKSNQLIKDEKKAHVVIIIGYNAETEEIAFSDSWGEAFTERWITVQEAAQISGDRYYTIGL